MKQRSLKQAGLAGLFGMFAVAETGIVVRLTELQHGGYAYLRP